MARLLIIPVLACSLMVIGKGESLFEDSKTTILPISFLVYLHSTGSGSSENSYVVGQANITSTSPTHFGLFRVTDDLITAGPDPNSQVLGRNEGTLINSGLIVTSLIVNFNFLFIAGPYQGSSLTLLGRKLFDGQNQEIPIVGGTGAFRLARGYAIASLYSVDTVTATTVFTYDIYIPGLLG